MKILLMTNSDHPDCMADCDCAVLDVTPALLERIRFRIEIGDEAAAADRKLSQMSFWGYGPEYYRYDLLDACAEAVEQAGDASQEDWSAEFTAGGLQPVPEAVELDRFEPRPTACDREIIHRCPPEGAEPEISWATRPKGTDICVETWPITLKRLQAFLSPECVCATNHD